MVSLILTSILWGSYPAVLLRVTLGKLGYALNLSVFICKAMANNNSYVTGSFDEVK